MLLACRIPSSSLADLPCRVPCCSRTLAAKMNRRYTLSAVEKNAMEQQRE